MAEILGFAGWIAGSMVMGWVSAKILFLESPRIAAVIQKTKNVRLIKGFI
jgi:hypothetical protein